MLKKVNNSKALLLDALLLLKHTFIQSAISNESLTRCCENDFLLLGIENILLQQDQLHCQLSAHSTSVFLVEFEEARMGCFLYAIIMITPEAILTPGPQLFLQFEFE